MVSEKKNEKPNKGYLEIKWKKIIRNDKRKNIIERKEILKAIKDQLEQFCSNKLKNLDLNGSFSRKTLYQNWMQKKVKKKF